MRTRTGQNRLCAVCNESFYVPGWNKTRKYCSRTCLMKGYQGVSRSPGTQFAKGQRPWNKGIVYTQLLWDKHPNFKGGSTRYAQMIQRIGIKPECERCGLEGEFGRKIQVHHRDHDRSNNTLDNLEVICSKCHAHEHKNWEARWLVS